MKMTHTTNAKLTKLDNTLAKLLDSQFSIPGTPLSVGIDPLLGLIPGFGDILGGLISLYYVARAIQEKMSVLDILKMILYILLEVLLGTVPIFGDLFDIWFKANKRNNAALQKHINARSNA
ncbi:MAG: DUF4112 domain-containing protein [Bdellovibrionaceae bacterium]|nr:DUF4112 domain-containing protein [Pseudobdellovibrionaceae bacterium]